MTQRETEIVALLMKRETLSRDGCCDFFNSSRPDCDGISPKCFDVAFSKLRRKLGPHGIAIETVHGFGWRLSPSAKAQVRQLGLVA